MRTGSLFQFSIDTDLLGASVGRDVVFPEPVEGAELDGLLLFFDIKHKYSQESGNSGGWVGYKKSRPGADGFLMNQFFIV